MLPRLSIIGNLVADAEKKTKDKGNTYHIFKVACNKNKDEAKYYTCFSYGLSDERAKLLTKGTQVYAYGIPEEKIYENEISLSLSVKDLEILNHKKQ